MIFGHYYILLVNNYIFLVNELTRRKQQIDLVCDWVYSLTYVKIKTIELQLLYDEFKLRNLFH